MIFLCPNVFDQMIWSSGIQQILILAPKFVITKTRLDLLRFYFGIIWWSQVYKSGKEKYNHIVGLIIFLFAIWLGMDVVKDSKG